MGGWAKGAWCSVRTGRELLGSKLHWWLPLGVTPDGQNVLL